MSITYTEAMNMAQSRPAEPSLTPFGVFLACAVGVVAALVLVAWNDATQFHRVSLRTQHCPPPGPGQVLVITVAPRNENGDSLTTCKLVTSQGTVRERIAKAGAQ